MAHHDMYVVKKECCPQFSLPERIVPGNMLILKGQLLSSPEESIRWSVNFVKKDFQNVPIHIVFQSQVGGDFGVWWCSSRVDGTWATMNGLHEPFPLRVGQPFELKVLFHQATFSVELNGEIYFEHIPIGAPFTLEDITGVILAGEWGQILVVEVGYLCITPSPDNFGYPGGGRVENQQPPKSTNMVQIGIPQNSYPQHQSQNVVQIPTVGGMYEQELQLEPLQGEHYLSRHRIESIEFPGELQLPTPFEPIPQLQPDPQLHTDPQLHPKLQILPHHVHLPTHERFSEGGSISSEENEVKIQTQSMRRAQQMDSK